MASLGSLVVSLGLNAVEFTTGLTKSEYEAKRFAKQFDQAVAKGVRAATDAMVAFGAAAAAAYVAIDQLAKQAGNFKDLEEKTGASAEALASFAISAEVAGVSVDDIAGGMNKLTKGLVSVEDETKDAGAALTALGIPIDDFKKLDPAAQVREVAKALAGFEDGASKTAVAMALFGKAGASLLPFLKELAGEGDRQIKLTQQQIETADRYADAQARARAEFKQTLQVLATEALPVITDVITVAKELARSFFDIQTEGNKFDASKVRGYFEDAVFAMSRVVDIGDSVIRIFEIIAIAAAAKSQAMADAWKLNFKGIQIIAETARKEIDAVLMKPLLSERMATRFAQRATEDAVRAREDRGFTPSRRRLDFSGKEGKEKADKISEAERFLESLQKQIDKTLELTVVQEAQQAMDKGMKGLTPELRERILATAALIDQYKELDKWLTESKKLWEEENRVIQEKIKKQEQVTEAAFREAQSIADGNDKLRDEIAIILGGDNARKALEQERIANAIAVKEEAMALAQLDPLRQSEAAALQSQIDLLKERAELLTGKSLAEQMKKEADEIQSVKDLLSDALTQPLEDFVNGTKSAKDAFNSFIKNIEQALVRIAARNLADVLFGGKTSSGPDIGSIFKWIMSLFGSASGAGGGVAGIGGFSGGGFGEHFAAGTAFAPGGMAWVGEGGPELMFVPRGARIMNARDSASGRGMVFNVNVMPGADTRSARQIGGTLRDVVVRSLKDR